MQMSDDLRAKMRRVIENDAQLTETGIEIFLTELDAVSSGDDVPAGLQFFVKELGIE